MITEKNKNETHDYRKNTTNYMLFSVTIFKTSINWILSLKHGKNWYFPQVLVTNYSGSGSRLAYLHSKKAHHMEACRAYSSCFMDAIGACMRLPFFKIFSNFIHFCPNFQIFSPFFPFFWTLAWLENSSAEGFVSWNLIWLSLHKKYS